MRKTKTYMMFKHQKKADAMDNALKQYGWTRTTNLHICSAAFLDVDILQRVEQINSLCTYGLKVFVYPHQARPNIIYAWKSSEPHPLVSGHFVSGPGHEEVMRRLGYEKPIWDIGWSFCSKKPFQPVMEVKNVLFGPLHPNGPHGDSPPWLHDIDIQTNRTAFSRLLKASKEMGFQLTVRYLHELSENGLKAVDGVTYVRGFKDNSVEHIDRADLVVGTQTFAYLAVARGKPTLFMDEHIAPKAGNSLDSFAYIRDWDKVKDLLMYPYDLNTTSDVNALIARASASDLDIRDWKSRMIGATFSGLKFKDIVNKTCGF